MAQRILYDTPTLTISFNYIDEWLYLDWHGNLDDETVMAWALKLLELLPQERFAQVLNDNTRISGLLYDPAQRGHHVFFPQLQAAGRPSFPSCLPPAPLPPP